MTKKFLQYKKKYLKLKGGSCKDDEEANLYVTDNDDEEHVENSNVILQPEPEPEPEELDSEAFREIDYSTSKYYRSRIKNLRSMPWYSVMPYHPRNSNDREEYKKRLEVFLENEEVQSIQKINRGKERGLHLCFIFETTNTASELNNIVKTFLMLRGLENNEFNFMFGRYENCFYIIKIERLIENRFILTGESFQGGKMQNIFKKLFDDIKNLFPSDRHKKGAGYKKEY